MESRNVMIAAAVLSFLACGPQSEPAPAADAGEPERLLSAVRDVETWLVAQAIPSEHGLLWPAGPAAPDTPVDNLYSGSPGVVLFLADLHALTDEATTLETMVAGAEALAAALPETAAEARDAGLYTGLAGQCVALHRAYLESARPTLLAAARRCVDAVRERAVPAGRGVQWSEVTDIISGSAGIGLMLLWASDTLGDVAALEVADHAGARLLEWARPEAGGSRWDMAPGFPRNMPNFSHGTAGVAYFLAALYRATGRDEYLRAALAGGRYLQSVADTAGDVCLIFHDEPDGTDLYYLSWCHGPAGTARLFHELFEITRDAEWLRWRRMSADAILASGIPGRRTPGFWNNVGQCCGSAGVAEFFLDLYRATGENRYRAFAIEVANDLVDRATRDEDGMRWVQAEHRVQPDNLAAQTGYMQGASGIGSMLLHLHATLTALPRTTVLPDSPFGDVPPRARLGQRAP